MLGFRDDGCRRRHGSSPRPLNSRMSCSVGRLSFMVTHTSRSPHFLGNLEECLFPLAVHERPGLHAADPAPGLGHETAHAAFVVVEPGGGLADGALLARPGDFLGERRVNFLRVVSVRRWGPIPGGQLWSSGKVSAMTGLSKLKYIMRTMGSKKVKPMNNNNGATRRNARILFLLSDWARAAFRLWPPMTSKACACLLRRLPSAYCYSWVLVVAQRANQAVKRSSISC